MKPTVDQIGLYARASIKYLTSFLKSDWTLADYLVRFRHFRMEESEAGRRRRPTPWTAQVVYWPLMFGCGQTREEAYADLQRRFDEYKGGGRALPRPGTRVKLEFELATTVEIERYEPLAGEFFAQILAMDYHECLVTDESSLWDFHDEETNEAYHRKIVAVYGVDVSDVESGNLVRIFQRICESRRQAQPAYESESIS